jgi:hypothetical protein
MAHKMARREAFQPMAAVSLILVAPGVVFGCSKRFTCSDAAGLVPDDVTIRTEVAKYQDQSPDSTKHCSICSLFLPAPGKGCAACQIVKGPINPDGYCTLYVAKP